MLTLDSLTYGIVADGWGCHWFARLLGLFSNRNRCSKQKFCSERILCSNQSLSDYSTARSRARMKISSSEPCNRGGKQKRSAPAGSFWKILFCSGHDFCSEGTILG